MIFSERTRKSSKNIIYFSAHLHYYVRDVNTTILHRHKSCQQLILPVLLLFLHMASDEKSEQVESAKKRDDAYGEKTTPRDFESAR